MAESISTGFCRLPFLQHFFKKNSNSTQIIFRCLEKTLLIVSCLLITVVATAQKDTLKSLKPSDTLKNDFVTSVQTVGAVEAHKSVEQFKAGRIAIRQDHVLEEIKKTTQKAKDFLKRIIDTSGLNKDLAYTDSIYAIAGDGIFTNRGTAQTYRNLTTSKVLLQQLLDKTNERKEVLDLFQKRLQGFRDKIDSLSSDSALYTFPEDSVAVVLYLKKLIAVSGIVKPTDSSLEQSLINADALETTIDRTANKLISALDQIESYEEELSDKASNREFANIWAPPAYSRPLNEIIKYSRAKNALALKYYVQGNIGKIFLVIALVIAFGLFLRTLKNNLKTTKLLRDDFTGQLVFRYPVLSATMIVLNISQFIFFNPPFIFNNIFWIVAAICLTFIFRKFITKFWMGGWLIMLTLFILSCLDNLILQASRMERWYMLFLSISGVISSSYFLLMVRKKELKEKATFYFICLAVLIELAATIANIYGRYNFSKISLTSGFINVIIGILFLWTIRLLNEVLAVASHLYNKRGKKLLYVDFDRVGKRVPRFIYFLFVIGWLTLFGRNFYMFRLISEPLKNFLFVERTIGDYTFTISKLLLFFLIMALSVITSKIVSFFASDNYRKGAGNLNEKTGLGSWLLLVRISIISIGLFIAVAAAGIPMDRITLILGALGVGVGFGLQTLVNNLVSGLVIAFEKPVNVGDIVEIGGQSGIMKSIGFRSSVISNWDGANVIIPNGDLLNAHLINWTLGKTSRRVEIRVGVAYGSSLEKTKQILNELLNADERILKNPQPVILFDNFNSSSIDIKLFYWVFHFSEHLKTKSDLIAAINNAFKENEIIIPFPQQDVYLHNAAGKDVNEIDKG